MTSDEIEKTFSALRSRQGSNDQTNAIGSLQAIELILKTGLVSVNSSGNCSADNEIINIAPTRKNITDSTMPEGSHLNLSVRQRLLLAKLQAPPGNSFLFLIYLKEEFSIYLSI